MSSDRRAALIVRRDVLRRIALRRPVTQVLACEHRCYGRLENIHPRGVLRRGDDALGGLLLAVWVREPHGWNREPIPMSAGRFTGAGHFLLEEAPDESLR